MTAYTVTFEKSDITRSRYEVLLDGEKVGWVTRAHWDDNKWSFFATVRRWAEGEKLAGGCATRRDAVMEGLSSLRIWHGSATRVLDEKTIQETYHYFEGARLEATWELLLEEKYA